MTTSSGRAIARTGNSFSDQVERALRDQILRGTYPPGGRLNEVEIATELGVSRGPVREAMQRLARDGLVVLQAHRGAFVRRLCAQEVRDLFEVRIALERTVAELAAERLEAPERAQLLALQAETDAEPDAMSVDAPFLGEHDIHAILSIAAGNQALATHVGAVNQELLLLRTQSGQTPDRAHDAISEHGELLDAVLRGDGPRAAAAMERHLVHALDYALRSMPDEDARPVTA